MELEPVEKAPICSICKLPKRRLRRLTQVKHDPIWVCAEKSPKAKSPCDGRLYEIAQANGFAA